MELKFLLIFASLSVVLVVSHASASPVIKLVTDLLGNGVGEWESPLPFLNNKYVAESEFQLPFYYKYVTESELEWPPLFYGKNDAADHTQLHDHDNPNVTLFFLQKDLHHGKILNLLPLNTKNPENLLPRKIAESIPFSSKYVSEIFEKFSVKHESKEAENIKTTLHECELPGIEGEDKYCATSLESMVDFIVSKLGRNIQAISTDVHEQTQKQKYTISRANKINWDDEAMVCHKQKYPYAVFYCHTITKSEAFSVSLVGENGGKIEVAAVCHKDTSAWDAKHVAFQILNVKPGDVPVCHFLPENHIIWVRK